MKVLFLDESGDHNLSVIDHRYPMFVLGGVLLDEDYANGPLTEALNNFKREIFDRTDIILHTADITRNRNGFEALKDVMFRTRFYDRINVLMRELRYSVVACAIRKNDHLRRYREAALDPYLFSLKVLVERFCFDIDKAGGSGLIVAEKRDPTLNKELKLAWSNLKTLGTYYLQARDIEDRIVGLKLKSKRDNIAGLQLADLVVSPIGRHILGKADKEGWRVVEENYAAAVREK